MKRSHVLAASAMTLLLSACGGSSPSSGTSTTASPSPSPAAVPGDTVKAYFQASISKDCATAFAQLTDPIKSRFGTQAKLCQSIQADTLASFTVTDPGANTGTTATVTVKLVRAPPGKSTTDSVAMLKVNGAWKISAFTVVS